MALPWKLRHQNNGVGWCPLLLCNVNSSSYSYSYSSTHFCPLDFSEMPWSNSSNKLSTVSGNLWKLQIFHYDNCCVLNYCCDKKEVSWIFCFIVMKWIEKAVFQGSRWRAKKSPCGCSLRFFVSQKRSGSRPVILPSRFANFNCFNSKTSVYFYYEISVFSFFNVSSGHCKGA